MRLAPEDFKEYEKNNTFMYRNHIYVCQAIPDCCIVAVDLQPDSLNLYGNVHGGLYYTMADCAAGLAARMTGDDEVRVYVTQSSYVNFLRGAKEGTIYAKGMPVKRGRTVTVVRVEVTDASGTLLAEATMNMFRTK